MTRTIVFIHGAWVTGDCWDRFVPFFEAKGYRCLAPSWPGKDRPVEAIRTDPSPLAGLGIGEIVDHYARMMEGLDEPPILIGHSFGGLFTQLLLDRGLGVAGIAIDSAPPKGVWAYEPTALRSLITTLLQWRVWRKVVRWKYSNFRYAFVHTLSEAAAHAAYDRYVIPESGRIFFQSAVALLSPKSPIKVNFANGARAPLLLIAGAKDRIVPPVINRRNHRAYAKSGARTDFREFPDRTHWIIAQDGWQEVAEHAAGWLANLGLD
ncbi:MAG: alpha/beta hydrolase [Chloroflexi bacterium]|nr:alpha/beta hydrolase [Chloroflexota bacterium]